LGIKIEVWGGAVLRWKEDGFSEKGVTAWNIEPHESNKFAPSQKLFMVNYRVDDLNEMLADLQKAGVEILKTEFGEYGKFAWVMDPDGNKVELWEP
jgi:catechol 2,3-dioxygenase-like lactoylglutathione lyase family enzyme